MKELLVNQGFDPQYGARPLRRAIQRLIEDPLAEEYLKGEFKPGDRVITQVTDNIISLKKSGG